MLRQLMPEHFHVPKYLGNKGWVGIWLDVPRLDWAAVELSFARSLRARRAEKTGRSARMNGASHKPPARHCE